MTNEPNDSDQQTLPLPNDRSPSQIEQEVLSVSSQSPADALAAAIAASDWLMSRAKAIQQLCHQIGIAWIEHNGDLAVGPFRYRVGYSTTTKCTDTIRCGNTLLKKLGGDLEGLYAALVSQPYKHGHVRNILDTDDYRSLFMTERTGKLINGVPERTLQRIDERFAQPRKSR